MPKPLNLWANDLIQFARLLTEILATQAELDVGSLCDSMDLEPDDIDELFDRAVKVFEASKVKHCPLKRSHTPRKTR